MNNPFYHLLFLWLLSFLYPVYATESTVDIEQLSNRGLLIKNGHASIIDASVIQAKNNRRKKNAAGENTQDPEASYNTKKGADGRQKTTYGFKAHINTDEDGFILAETLTIGKVYDSQVFEELLTGEEAAVYADSAYKSKAHDKVRPLHE